MYLDIHAADGSHSTISRLLIHTTKVSRLAAAELISELSEPDYDWIGPCDDDSWPYELQGKVLEPELRPGDYLVSSDEEARRLLVVIRAARQAAGAVRRRFVAYL